MLLLALLLACADPLPASPAGPPPAWSLNPDNARGVGASFAVEDLNHDGLVDLVFGAPLQSGPTVYGVQVWLGGPGPSFSFDEATIGPTTPTASGASLALCDLDGDGWTEIAVGEPDGPECGVGTAPTCPADARRGRIVIYRYGRYGLERAPQAELLGAVPGGQLGQRLLCPGDMDHDGWPDLLTTAPRARDAADREGLVLMYRGGPQGVSATPAWSAGQQGAWAAEGEALAVADMNGDGWLDVLTGAPEWDEGWFDEGRVALYLNGPGGLDDAPAQVWYGQQHWARFGAAIAAGADVHGDGYPDLLVGAPGADLPLIQQAGRALLYSGGPGGPANLPGWTWEGALKDEELGATVAMADQDGDAFAEVLIGMLRRHTITPQAAMASLPGSPGGPETSRPLWYRGTTVVRSGAWHTADVGDLDGDGLHDLMIGLVPSQGTLHNGLALHPGRPQSWDGDQDGAPARDDCDDEDASRGARSPELPADGVDSDCDGRELCPTDLDSDGHASIDARWVSSDADCDDWPERPALPRDDCDDLQFDQYGGAAELPSDGRSQTCDTTVRCYVDADGDGFPASTASVRALDGDCDDPGEAAVLLQTRDAPYRHLPSWETAASGDLDGDAAIDLIAPLNGSSGGRSGFAVYRAQDVQHFDDYGWNPADASTAAADLDGDGFDDLVWLGAYHGPRSANFTTTLTIQRGGLAGPSRMPWFSRSDMSTLKTSFHAADLNSDGIEDLVLGRSGPVTEPTGTASVHIVYGRADGLDWSNGLALTQLQAGSVAPDFASGDLDADGFTDLVVQLPVRHLGGGDMEQALWVLRGGPGGLEAFPGWPLAQLIERFRAPEVAVDDFDQDGFDDLAVAWDCGMNESCLDVYEGGADGPDLTPDLSTRLGPLGLPAIHDTLIAPGDLDGDGFPDLVISAWDLGLDRIATVFGSARGLVVGSSTVALEDVGADVLLPAGDGPFGAAIWKIGEHPNRTMVHRTDIRYLAPDCNDRDARVHPAAWDAPGDDRDQDCDGYDTCWFDRDQDCLPDPDGAVTPDVSRRCEGPRELPPVSRVSTLAVAGRRCPVALP
jgi:hypothetical protein